MVGIDDDVRSDSVTSETSASVEPSEDNPQGLAGVPSIIAEATVAALTGIPPQVQRSFYKALNHVFMAGANWPASYLKGRSAITSARARVEVSRLDAQAAGIKAEQRAKELVIRESAKAASSQFSDPLKAERAFDFHARNILRDQDINEDIIMIAAEEIRNKPPHEDSTVEINDDWLNAFFREAPTRSTSEYKTLFGRILAGEIKQPGTFSLGTLRALANLTAETAKIFQSFCNISTAYPLDPRAISDPFGEAGDNSLREYGLDYTNLVKLVENGLIRPSFTEWQEITPMTFEVPVPFDHANIKLLFKSDGTRFEIFPNPNLRVNGPAMTTFGSELRQIVTMKYSPVYLAKLSSWLKKQNIDLYAMYEEDNKSEWKVVIQS